MVISTKAIFYANIPVREKHGCFGIIEELYNQGPFGAQSIMQYRVHTVTNAYPVLDIRVVHETFPHAVKFHCTEDKD